MKDLTHYFVSPPKSSENIDVASLNNLENASSVITTGSGNNSSSNNDKSLIIEKQKSRVEKRSRVKIRISLKDSKNSRCDIIENKNDVVDKTPSPFKKSSSTITRKNSSYETKDENTSAILLENDDNQKAETHNAFELLMTRNKLSPTTPRDEINSLTPTSQKSSGADIPKKRLNKERHVSKRKHAEIDEAEFIENGLKKQTKLLRRDEAEGKGDSKEGKIKNKKKQDPGTRSKDKEKNLTSNSVGPYNNNNVRKKHGEKKIDRRSKTVKNSTDIDCNDDRNETTIEIEEPENFRAIHSLGKEQTPKNKPKWTMRVKLQSHSDDEREGDNGYTTDDDYIFTPKSKVKYQKRGVRKISSSSEAKEEKNPEVETEEQEQNKEETTATNSHKSSTKRGKYRVKKNINKLKNLESNNGEMKKLSTKIEERIIDVVEILDNSVTEIDDCPKIVQEKKLAPLFVRRSKPNPAAIEARKSFLQSGIPETVKKMILEQKLSCNDAGAPTMPFPAISHVSQSQNELDSEMESSGRNFETLYKKKSDQNEQIASLLLDSTKFKSLSNFEEKILQENGKTDPKKLAKVERENFETVLKEVESRCSETRTMWESIVSAASNRTPKKSPKKRTKKLKLQRKADAQITEDKPDNPNPTWTCKYKPMSSVEVVGNESAIAKLRNWLSGWRRPSRKDDLSSGDEFYSSDCSSSSLYENNQVAVLLGPHGSGKTASVYAIAEELGYRVLEVNASSKRKGKKILSDFLEATKSHRVKRGQGILLPTKKKTSEKKVPQNSLILIEDVDIIFEEDEGFVSATFQLAANTRRPIVMTCKESCPHLNRMAPQQQFIHFQTATGNRVSALLELIALAESGYRLPRSCLDILLRNGDLRQSLLQLQYILLSGPPSISQLGTSPGLTMWADMQPLIYKPAIKSMKKSRKESTGDKKLLAEEERKLINALANKLDSISLISSITEVENPASPPWNRKLSPSLSFEEDFKPYTNSADLSIEIANWLTVDSFGSDLTETTSETNFESKSQLAIKRKVKLGIDLALSQAVPSTLEHRSKSIDYLPIIRTMCRSEQDRASINNKRGNRFHNYLHGLNLASASSNVLSAASSIFKDKST